MGSLHSAVRAQPDLGGNHSVHPRLSPEPLPHFRNMGSRVQRRGALVRGIPAERAGQLADRGFDRQHRGFAALSRRRRGRRSPVVAGHNMLIDGIIAATLLSAAWQPRLRPVFLWALSRQRWRSRGEPWRQDAGIAALLVIGRDAFFWDHPGWRRHLVWNQRKFGTHRLREMRVLRWTRRQSDGR